MFDRKNSKSKKLQVLLLRIALIVSLVIFVGKKNVKSSIKGDLTKVGYGVLF